MLSRMILALQHHANPLHIYCRLRSLPLPKQALLRLCRCYEVSLYNCLLLPASAGLLKLATRLGDQLLPPPGEKENLMLILMRAGEKNIRTRHRIKVLVWKTTIGLTYGLKRSLDILVASCALLLLLPLFVITALVIYVEDPGAIFYTQIRVGTNGRHFRFYKFRSMRINADRLKTALTANNESRDGVIFKMKKDPRITRVGRIIRKFSIDELPQLVNVLKGDMSLVGPRPPLPQEVAQYTLEQRKRLHIRPGITCTWQVSGRSDIPFIEQVNLDLDYIHNAGLLTDLVILLKTIPAVLTGKGAY